MFEKAKFIDGIKFGAKTTNKKPREVVPVANGSVDQATLATTPSMALLRRTVARVRVGNIIRKNPKSLDEFEVNDEYAYTKKTNHFYFMITTITVIGLLFLVPKII